MIGRRRWTPWLWLAPAGALLGVFLVYPTLDTLRRSVMDARSRAFVGLDNFRVIVDNPRPFVADTHLALGNNALWLVAFTGLTLALGLAIAVLADKVRYESAVAAAVFVPMAISFVAAAVIWRFVYDFDPQVGTLNAVWARLGGEPVAWLTDAGAPYAWLTDRGPRTLPGPLRLNNMALIVVGTWMWTGFAAVVLSAALKGIPGEILEAARVDGAGEWPMFRRIVLPLTVPTLAVVGTTLLIQALKSFDLVWVMTGGRFGTDVVATLFYKQAFVQRDFGLGAALAVVLMAGILPVMLVNVRHFLAEGRRR